MSLATRISCRVNLSDLSEVGMKNNFLGLKILVSAMGVMVVVGTIVVAYTIIKRMGEPVVLSEPKLATTEESLKPFGEKTVKLPYGTEIEEMALEGKSLMLRIRATNGRESIIIYNLKTGERLGVLRLNR